MKRSEYKGVHSNQVCFPGGAEENHDNSILATALRETWEELGIESNLIKVLGSLSPLFIPVSNFIVNPFVAYLEEPPIYKLDPSEVSDIIEISIKDLLEDKNEAVRTLKHSVGGELETPCFIFGQQIVWGATAMMLAELKEIIRAFWSSKN